MGKRERMLFKAAVGSALGLFMVGCYNYDTSDRNVVPVQVSHALTQMDSCDAYLAYAKETAIQRMLAITEEQCQSMLDNAEYNGSNDGGFFGWGGDDAIDAMDDSNPTAENGDVNGSGETPSHSETNTQEMGVDEADLVKTDGQYVYAVSGKDLILVAVDAGGMLTETSRIALEGTPQDFFLYKDKVIVFSNLTSNEVPKEMQLPAPLNYYGDLGIPEPGMDMNIEPYYSYGSYSSINVIDITDKAAPQIIKNTKFAGRYVSSRRVDNRVRMIISTPLSALDVPTWISLDYWNMEVDEAKDAINSACDDLIAKNKETINALTLDDLMPKQFDTLTNTLAPISQCEAMYGPITPAGTGLLSVISLDADAPLDARKNVSVIGQEGIVYASTEALYLTTARDYAMSAWRSGLWTEASSGIYKFDLSKDAAEARYLASGTVQGRMLNQFCLGEKDGFLRVATTTGSAWEAAGNTLDSHLFVFQQQNDKLTVVGHLDGIGTGEEIYAARFMGDRGFVVTYLQTDPLFTFDLSDPTHPKKIGEWIGPGYSTYIHPYGDHHLITLGRTEEWNTSISLYDVSNFGAPSLVERKVLPGPTYETSALYEHKAFTFNSETGDLLLPFYDYNATASTGILHYTVSPSGVDLNGSMVMGGDINIEGPSRRALYIGENLIGVSACRITTAPLANPGQILSSLPIFGASCMQPYWWVY